MDVHADWHKKYRNAAGPGVDGAGVHGRGLELVPLGMRFGAGIAMCHWIL